LDTPSYYVPVNVKNVYRCDWAEHSQSETDLTLWSWGSIPIGANFFENLSVCSLLHHRSLIHANLRNLWGSGSV